MSTTTALVLAGILGIGLALFGLLVVDERSRRQPQTGDTVALAQLLPTPQRWRPAAEILANLDHHLLVPTFPRHELGVAAGTSAQAERWTTSTLPLVLTTRDLEG